MNARNDIRGWTWKIGQVCIEFVTIQHALRVIAVSTDNGRKLFKRWEW